MTENQTTATTFSPADCVEVLQRFEIGDYATPDDKGNVGQVMAFDDSNNSYQLEFTNPDTGDVFQKWFNDSDLSQPKRTQVKGNRPAIQLPAPAFKFLSVSDVLKQPNPKFLIDGLLSEKSFVVLYGKPGSFKSFIALDWALSLGFGVNWFEHELREPDKPVSTVYVASEGFAGLKKRVEAWLQFHQMRDDFDNHFHVICEPLLMLEPIHVDAFIEAVDTQLKKIAPAPALIVFDTLSRCMIGGDENSARDMGEFVYEVNRICKSFDATGLVIHHSGKNAAAGLRGSTALLGAADSVFKIEKKDERKAFLVVEKSKDQESENEIVLTMEQVETGIDEKGNPINSLICSEANSSETQSNCKVTPDRTEEELLYLLLCYFQKDVGACSSKWLVVAKDNGWKNSAFYKIQKRCLEKEFVKKDGRNASYRVTDEGKSRATVYAVLNKKEL